MREMLARELHRFWKIGHDNQVKYGGDRFAAFWDSCTQEGFYEAADALLQSEKLVSDQVRRDYEALAMLLDASKEMLYATVDASTYPDGPCAPKEIRDDLRDAIKRMEGILAQEVPDGT